MNRKKILVSLCVFILIMALTACGQGNNTNTATQQSSAPASDNAQASATSEPSPSPGNSGDSVAPETRTVKDDLGHELQIPAHPKHVLAPYLEDPLTALGVKPVAQWANGDIVQEYLQNELSGLSKVDFSAGGLIPEQAAAQQPDLIVLIFKEWADKGLYESYSKIAPTYVFENGMTDWRKTLRTLGDLLGQTNKAEQEIKAFDSKVADAKEKIKGAIGDQEVALLWPSGKNLFLLSAEDYSGKLLYDELGIKEPALAHGQSFQNISLEKLPEIGKGHIFLITQYNDTESGQLMTSEVWKGLPAVKEGRVHEISWNHWMNNGLIANQLNLEDTLQALVK
jgi:iron complex transport system substrate-binding protein